jgi:predicted RecA/RadA family phage recombinase
MAIEIERADKVMAFRPAGTVSAGEADVVQQIWGVWMKAGTTAADAPFCIHGRFKGVTKTAGATWTIGQRLYWDDTTEQTFKTGSTSASTLMQNIIAGKAAESADTTGTVEIA